MISHLPSGEFDRLVTCRVDRRKKSGRIWRSAERQNAVREAYAMQSEVFPEDTLLASNSLIKYIGFDSETCRKTR